MRITMLTQSEVDTRKAEADRVAEIDALTALLSSTDWYAVRLAETGKAIPESIAKERQAARDRISELRDAKIV